MRKGKYPGGPKEFIYDKKVWNGGASDERVAELWERQEEGKRMKMEKNGGGVNRRGSQRGSVYRQSQGYTMNGSHAGGRSDGRGQMSQGVGNRRNVVDEISGRY